MRAVSADFRAGDQNLESEGGFDLTAYFLQRFAEKFLYAPAPEADHVGVLLLHTGFVVMLIAAEVHQVELVHQAALFQHLQSAIYSHPVQLRVLLLGHLVKPFGVQVFAGLVDQFQKDLPLARETHTALLQGVFCSNGAHNNSDATTVRVPLGCTDMVETARLQALRERIVAFVASRVQWDLAEDIAQETMLVLHTKYPQVTEVGDLVPLSLQIARFKLAAAIRKAHRRGEDHATALDDTQLASLDSSPEVKAARDELLARLRQALPKMGPRCRELLRLKLIGRSFGEIQREMGAASINTVYTWDLRCRKQLRELVGDAWANEKPS